MIPVQLEGGQMKIVTSYSDGNFFWREAGPKDKYWKEVPDSVIEWWEAAGKVASTLQNQLRQIDNDLCDAESIAIDNDLCDTKPIANKEDQNGL